MTTEAEYEKLGLFYLGRAKTEVDETAAPVLYDSRHLVTHGLCVGMTGSGKTGLGIGLLEEAAIDGVPALVIDPKGDMGNLLLTFPNLEAADFAPWVDPAEAERKGLRPDELATKEAEKWRRGLADWGQDGERIKRLREAVDITLYTPGSTAGVPLAVLSSLAAPGETVRTDRELMGDRVATASSSLLGLAGLKSDARSREYVLLSTLLSHSWSQGQGLDLPSLILQIQDPPVTRIGVLELESFYPAKDRFELAMALNSLLASPGFSAWLEGQPLDIDRMLYGEDGKPRVAICSIAHLDDRERMFFVSLLLEQVVAWMREQSGTSSLRALVYMDEIYGYLPPVAEPPSKRPLLTLLKQARAFGVGLVLATQNPVDLDYKALSNIGTWFLGRLQTERDKLRLLDGLEGASGGKFSRGEIDQILSGLPKRTFLLHDVREPEPVLFQTRWVLSYLKGPLTRVEIERLTAEQKPAAGPQEPGARLHPAGPGAGVGGAAPAVQLDPVAAAPVLPRRIGTRYVDLGGRGEVRSWQPYLLGEARVRFEDRKSGTRHDQELYRMAEIPVEGDLADWTSLDDDIDSERIADRCPFEAPHDDLPPAASVARNYTHWKKELVEYLYHDHRLELWRSPSLEESSWPGESERDFRIRLGQLARERRDAEKAERQDRYDKQVARLEARRVKAEQKVAVQEEQLSEKKLSTAVSFGTTLLGALLGRKRLSRSALSGASRAVRGVGASRREASDVARAREDLARIEAELTELEAELGRELLELSERYRPDRERLETTELAPLKKNIRVRGVDLFWLGR